MRILHTSDWHLGHQLHGHGREWEHDVFLTWLLEQLVSREIDVLLIAGDIFDSSNPPARVLSVWYQFLANVLRHCPAVQIVAIGGNHDSAARLEAPNPLLKEMKVRVVGGVPRTSEGNIDLEALTIPLTDPAGEVRAWCAAMPFIRISDIPTIEDSENRIVAGIRQMYTGLMSHIRARATPDQAIIATGHCFMTNAAVSQMSERKVLGGNQNPLPEDIFGLDPTYVALGHLHRAQIVNGRNHIRYCGTPLPLSLQEGRNKQQVLLITLEGSQLKGIEPLYTPSPVAMISLPAAPPRQILAQIESMEPLSPELPEERRPFLEVCVALERPEPELRRKIEQAMRGKIPRLVSIKIEYSGDGKALADGRTPSKSLVDMNAEDVFLACYRRYYEDDPPTEILEMFHQLLTGVMEAES